MGGFSVSLNSLSHTHSLPTLTTTGKRSCVLEKLEASFRTQSPCSVHLPMRCGKLPISSGGPNLISQDPRVRIPGIASLCHLLLPPLPPCLLLQPTLPPCCLMKCILVNRLPVPLSLGPVLLSERGAAPLACPVTSSPGVHALMSHLQAGGPSPGWAVRGRGQGWCRVEGRWQGARGLSDNGAHWSVLS